MNLTHSRIILPHRLSSSIGEDERSNAPAVIIIWSHTDKMEKLFRLLKQRPGASFQTDPSWAHLSPSRFSGRQGPPDTPLVFILLVDKSTCPIIMASDPIRRFTKKDRVIQGQGPLWGMRYFLAIPAGRDSTSGPRARPVACIGDM